MKHTVMIKRGLHPTINHLYEHLYCIALVRALKENGFLDYIDYRFEAKNYHVGFIYIAITYYNSEIEEYINPFNINLSYSDKDIQLACTQISAEYQLSIQYNQDTRHQLKLLHSQEWEDLANSSAYNWRHSVASHKAKIKTTPISSRNFRSAKCELLLDNEYVHQNELALPIFHELSRAILYNLSNTLTDIYGYFGTNSASTYSNTTTKETHYFSIHHQHTLSPTELASVIRQSLSELLKSNIEARLQKYIENNYVKNSEFDELDIFETTGILLGQEGWRDVLEKSNLNDIINHTSMNITTRHDSKTIRIST